MCAVAGVQGKMDADKRQQLIQKGQELKDTLSTVESRLAEVRKRQGKVTVSRQGS